MSRYIVKLSHAGKDYYLDYSTVVDSPVTFGLSKDEFYEYYKEEYGNRGLIGLQERMKRVEEKGTSAFHKVSAESTLAGNRAGKNEAELSIQEIIDFFCIKREDPD